MANLTNTIQNSALSALGNLAPKKVLHAIEKASTQTGVDFSYLLQQASVESAFDYTAKAATSSATGLYQFIESTWLSMVGQYGDKHGMDDLASFIDANGKVSDPQKRQEILALRKDPEKASLFAAEFANENYRFLDKHWAKGEKDIGSTELYLAHFMGASGAASFLNARDQNSMNIAADIFPAAAKANYNVFYDRNTGKARTLDQVYAFFDKKFEPSNEKIQLAGIANKAPKASPRLEKSYDNYPQISTLNQADANAILSHVFLNPSLERAKSFTSAPSQNLIMSPIEIMLLADMELPFGRDEDNLL